MSPTQAMLRGIVDEAFRRRAVLEMEPRILEIAGELADELPRGARPISSTDMRESCHSP